MRIVSKVLGTVFVFLFSTVALSANATASTCSKGREVNFYSWPTKAKVSGNSPLVVNPPSGYSFSPFGTVETLDAQCVYPPCQTAYEFSQVTNPDPSDYKGTYLFGDSTYLIELASPSMFKAVEVGLVHYASPGFEWALLDRNMNVVVQGTAAKNRNIPEEVLYTESWTSGFKNTNMHY